MRDFDGILKYGDDIEIRQPTRQEYKFIGRIRIHPGQKLYEFNTETREINEVKLTGEVQVDRFGKPVKRLKAHNNPKCIYVTAINMKNAKRKFIKLITNLIIKKHGTV